MSARSLGRTAAARAEAAGRIQAACRDRGFFYVTGHGVPTGCSTSWPARAPSSSPCRWRTSWRSHGARRAGLAGILPGRRRAHLGRPDLKEGLYFGAELPDDDPRVLAGVPLHGRNLFPPQVPRLRPLVLAYLDALTALGQAVLTGWR